MYVVNCALAHTCAMCSSALYSASARSCEVFARGNAGLWKQMDIFSVLTAFAFMIMTLMRRAVWLLRRSFPGIALLQSYLDTPVFRSHQYLLMRCCADPSDVIARSGHVRYISCCCCADLIGSWLPRFVVTA